MPAILEADWDQAKELYIQGTPCREIAQKTGVTEVALRTRASRHKWAIERLKVSGKLRASDKAVPTSRPTLQRKIAALVEGLPDVAPKKGLRAVADTALTLAHAAKIAEGWQENTTNIINVWDLGAPGVTSLPDSAQLPESTHDTTVTDVEVVHDSNVSNS